MSARRVIAASIAVALAAAVVLSALSPFLISDDDGAAPAITAASQPAPLAEIPDVVISDLDGEPVALRSLAGRPLVINYWFSTCPPCMLEMPALAEVAAEYSDRVRFVGINPQDTAERARSFAADRGVTYEQFLDHTGRSVDGLELTGFPSTVLVTADGRIALVQRAALTAPVLRDLIEQHLLP